MTRWILAIQEFDFDIQHCKGRDNIVANILSRNPEDIDAETENKHEELEINQISLKISKECSTNIKQMGKLQVEDEKN